MSPKYVQLYLDNVNEKAESNDNTKEEDDFFAQCHIDNNGDAIFQNNNVEINIEKVSLRKNFFTLYLKLECFSYF